jgi:cobyric acid synthase CobQ/L-threonine-O-3-phosphate decarboxylase
MRKIPSPRADLTALFRHGERAAVPSLLNFSVSTNPLGPPASVLQALQQNMRTIAVYPDADCRGLTERLACYHRVAPAQVVVGNGSNELIYAIVRAFQPRRVAIVEPTFTEYLRASRLGGATVDHWLAEGDDFEPACFDPEGADLVWLGNPNNPTGRLWPKEQLREWIGRHGRTVFVVDEAFLPFLEDERDQSLIAEVDRLPNVIVLRSLTKLYALPGLRLGYAVTSAELAVRLRAQRTPWSVNSLAQVAGLAALDDTAFIAQTHRWLSQERDTYLGQLAAFPEWLQPLSACANFVLLRLQQTSSQELAAGLTARGIAVRDASNFVGLDGRYVRVAVRTRPDNQRLIDALEELCDRARIGSLLTRSVSEEPSLTLRVSSGIAHGYLGTTSEGRGTTYSCLPRPTPHTPRPTTRALMIQGTASHVGKSVLTAAFGRWLREQGLRVAPFKAQNMSLNSFVTLRGEEIARSQATQAEALGLEPSADMNPVLLKPLDHGCQVVMGGHGVGIMSIHDYYAYKPQAWNAIISSYDRLAAAYDAIVLEGAGSPVEINLKANDLVNMRMAEHARAAVILVADIERGGVFAQLIGTWDLLEPPERERVIGFIINKFRGDASLLRDGLAMIEERTNRPVLGVLPFDAAVQLDEEDSLGLARGPEAAGDVEVAVLRLPGLANFTDFAALARVPGLAVGYISDPARLQHADLIVLPGTRTTLRALQWLRATGFDTALERLAADSSGPYILGLCGGYQLLGRTIDDPEEVEGAGRQVPGLGLLDIDTLFQARKTLHRVEAEALSLDSLGCGTPLVGYEVHQGISTRRVGARPWLRLHRQPGGEFVDDGTIRGDGRVCGTYVHGLFDDARFCRALVVRLRQRRGLPPLAEQEWLSQREFWARRYQGLASWLAEHCDLHPVAAALELPPWKR